MLIIFTEQSPYKHRAKLLAIGWTLLIFILCFLPGNELPDIRIPFIDKWAHIILFGVFSFLWMCGNPTRKTIFLLIIFGLSVFVGWMVEYIQGHYVEGRTQDNMDTLADSVGGLIGIVLFVVLYNIANKKLNGSQR
ncbi:MAG: VanZ family protein [Chitinophagales bacterium]|nr:VanZ family protein [Chitinophagales bacterium]